MADVRGSHIRWPKNSTLLAAGRRKETRDYEKGGFCCTRSPCPVPLLVGLCTCQQAMQATAICTCLCVQEATIPKNHFAVFVWAQENPALTSHHSTGPVPGPCAHVAPPPPGRQSDVTHAETWWSRMTHCTGWVPRTLQRPISKAMEELLRRHEDAFPDCTRSSYVQFRASSK